MDPMQERQPLMILEDGKKDGGLTVLVNGTLKGVKKESQLT